MGLAGTLLFLGLTGEPAPGQAELLWAAAAGASGVIGIGCFYRALSRGTMGVVAPLTAVIGAGVPVFLDLVGGDVVPTARLIGIGVALAAVVLISLPPKAPNGGREGRALRVDMRELPLVVASGLGFAGFFMFIGQASAAGAVWWPLAVVRLVGLVGVLGAFLFLAMRSARDDGLKAGAVRVLGVERLRRAALRPVVVIAVLATAGIGDLGGNVFFVLASQADAFAVAVILSSLYPVVTTVLAALLLHERLRAVQVVGVILATLSVVLLR